MSDSPIFRCIAEWQGNRPWGRFLDAGTGSHSLRWVAGLQTDAWTAITGAEGMARQVRDTVSETQRSQDRIVVGDWADPDLLAGDSYDTVLADYLLGAIDGFAPYFQPYLFARLRPLVSKQLYIVGLQPYVPYFPDDDAGQVITRIGRTRDACLLLAGERPYREYPLDWVCQHLEASGFRVEQTRQFPIRYGQRFVQSQIAMCEARLPRFADAALAEAMAATLDRLRHEALALDDRLGGLRHGFDYVVSATPR
ncbi:class I SAM-dependent methyltransferase [Achromobacter sp. GG226]|uniref:class I SAM-dependent methyltransferase n=1 Tax=Verticiella alkaliphila TaxID=2779529 RepID=UPI001C0C5359|nr:class I SAM-dependent methyltransferase [Verticiella sp. GG226]MBU4611600.1 class I SAM-dependent methyltransferase [Verticiella sp. GG226]